MIAEQTIQTVDGFRNRVLEFENQLATIPGAKTGDNDTCRLKHSFSDGIYVREIFIPKGTLLTGKIHRHSHPNFLMSGEVTVMTEEDGVQNLKGPLSMISKPGTKRIVFAHTDVVWVTVHSNVTNETDLAKIEQEVIAPSYEDLAAVEDRTVKELA